MKKTVLVIDGGGRGAALVDAYAKSPHVGKILAVPGNDLMQSLTDKPVLIYPHLKTTSVQEILEIAKKEKVDLVDVAQDNGVEAGNTDVLLENGFKVNGPTRKAGQIEWDKVYSRELLKKTSAPQPAHEAFSNFEDGINFIKSQPDKPWFVKAAGLAEGKGALPAKNNAEAIERIKELERFGESGKNFLIEEWLIGEEFSAFMFSDGKTAQWIGAAQDHKRVFDGDEGENTGGMGCSTPPLVLTKEVQDQAIKIMNETLQALRDDGRPYQGVLYFGGILVNRSRNVIPVNTMHPESKIVDPGGAKASQDDSVVYVIEFNARWGDPEAEVLIPGITNDYYEVSEAIADRKLDSIKIETDGKYRVVVAGASKGYPTDYSAVKGKEIHGLEEAIKTLGIKVYGAGVKVLDSQNSPRSNKKFVANGGRLFYLVGEGKDVIEAREKAYSAMKKISIEGNNLHYRTDIGYRDVNRLNPDTTRA